MNFSKIDFDITDSMLHPQQFQQQNPDILTGNSLKDFASYCKAKTPKKIIVMTGAGISTSAGIPDFRSPGTGLYDNLLKYNLPFPEAIFEIGYFKQKPNAFFTLAKELFPGNFNPTVSHYFIRLLAEKGLLLRNYTQNIDTLERFSGISPDLLVEAHGSFSNARCVGGVTHIDYIEEKKHKTSSFVVDVDGLVSKVEEINLDSQFYTLEDSQKDEINLDSQNKEKNVDSQNIITKDAQSKEEEINANPQPTPNEPESNTSSTPNTDTDFLTRHVEQLISLGCNREYPTSWLKKQIFEGKIPKCLDITCKGLVKPDIVFFGESLPPRFHQLLEKDFESADLLIVMGTSLQVRPFSSLIDFVGKGVPRLLVNRERCGEDEDGEKGFDFEGKSGIRRDAFYQGSCDEGCMELAELMGWKNELILMMAEHLKELNDARNLEIQNVK